MYGINGIASRTQFSKKRHRNFNAFGILNQGITLQVQIGQDKSTEMLFALVSGQWSAPYHN